MIGREGIRGLAIIWFDEGKTEVEIAELLFISARPFAQCKSLVGGKENMNKHGSKRVRRRKIDASKAGNNINLALEA